MQNISYIKIIVVDLKLEINMLPEDKWQEAT